MWKRIQMLLALFMLIYIAGLTGPSKLPEGGVDPVAGKISNVLQILIIPPFLLMVVVHRRKMLAGLRAALFPVLISLMVVFSTYWSLEPRITLRRGVVFLFITLFGVYMGSCLSQFEQLNMYAKMTIVTIVGCLLTGIFFPDYGISQDVHAGEWKGLFQHKNILGRQAAFCFALLLGGKPFRSVYLRWTAIAGTFLLLGLSRSGTGLIGFVAVLAAYLLVKLMRIREKKTLPLWFSLVPITVLSVTIAFTFRDTFFAIFGKDSTLTGRTRIWQVAFVGMSERPWLGFGYNTYWRQQIIGRFLPYGLAANHAHNGYLDLVLDIGYVGMALFMIALSIYTFRVMKDIINQRIPLSNFTVFAFLSVVVLLSLNLTESNLLREHTFLWLPFVSIYTALALQHRYERQLTVPTTTSEIEQEELVHQVA